MVGCGGKRGAAVPTFMTLLFEWPNAKKPYAGDLVPLRFGVAASPTAIKSGDTV